MAGLRGDSGTPKKPLTDAFIRKLPKPKKRTRHYDGRGLFLIHDVSGSKRWIVRVAVGGRSRDVGLGGYPDVGLADARDLASDLRRKARDGKDPVAALRVQRQVIPTFKECAELVHAANMPSWKNGKHTAQWLATLKLYAFPMIGHTPVDKVARSDVHAILSKIWLKKPETARRVLQRLRAVLDYAIGAELREHEIPFRAIVKALPKQMDVVEHHAALPYEKLPAFIPKLRAFDCADVVKLAFELLILTGLRSGELRGARVDEFDLNERIWTIPAPRMKGTKKAMTAHIVPLSDRAIEIFHAARKLSPKSELLFPGRYPDKPLSDMAFTMVLRRLGYTGIATAHGFRSSLDTWGEEQTDFPEWVREKALAHKIKDKVTAAYRRGELVEKRRAYMQAWADFVLTPAADDVAPVRCDEAA